MNLDRKNCQCNGCKEYRNFMQAMTIAETQDFVPYWVEVTLNMYALIDLPECEVARAKMEEELQKVFE